jgi:hypothetical protein
MVESSDKASGGAAEHGSVAVPSDGPDGGSPVVVFGRVLDQRGAPVAGALVRAAHRRLRHEDELGSARTDGNGEYRLQAPARFSTVDLTVRVFDAGGRAIVESPLRLAVSAAVRVDLDLGDRPARPSEYEILLAAVTRALDGARLEELSERADQPDVSLLARQSGQQAERVALLAVAHKIAARTGLAPELCYAFGRMGLATTVTQLLAATPEARSRALRSAVGNGIVPARLADDGSEIEQRIRLAAAERLAGSGRWLEILSEVLPGRDDLREFTARYLAHEGPVEQFWQEMAKERRLGPRVGQAQLAIQLAALTAGHPPLVRELLGLHRSGELASFRDLARFDIEGWERLIRSQGVPPAQWVPDGVPGDAGPTRVRLYAETLERIVADAVPTAAMAYRAADDQSLPADERTFWRNVASHGDGFALERVRVAQLPASRPELFAGVADVAALTRTLASVQRLANLGAAYPELRAMRDAGFGSAHDVARVGPEAFTGRLASRAVDRLRAKSIYRKALRVVLASAAVVTNYHPRFQRERLYVLPGADPVQVPNLTTLFGSLDSCDCAECQSVAGPAAYFAEILAFLGDRAQGRTNARDILAQRRRDLAWIELTCDNTNLVLPYVDLVNEVLEDAVAPFPGFDLPAVRASELDSRVVSDRLLDAFASRDDAPLGQNAIAVVVDPGRRWLVTDHSVLYLVVRSKDGLRVTLRAYQTGAPADQLAVSPEHVNDGAYQVLRATLFPLDAPLDLWREQVTTFLSHLKVRRDELMQEFSTATQGAGWLTDLAMVGEHLGLTALERQLLTGGLRVRAVITSPLRQLTGLVGPGLLRMPPGSLVLVAGQRDPRRNGVWTVGLGPWRRRTYSGLVSGPAPDERWQVGPATGVQQTVTRIRPWTLWGLAEDGNKVAVFDPAAGDQPVQRDVGWLEALRWVPSLLGRSGLSYDELVAVLGAGYVNPGGRIRIASADPADATTCEVGKLALTATDRGFAQRLNMFVRLWRRVGWNVADLDRAITVFGGDVSAATLRGVSHVGRLHERLGLPVEQVLVFFGALPTAGGDPLYQRLFLNAAVHSPVDEDFAIAGGEVLAAGRTDERARLDAHLPALLAALGATAAELSALFELLPAQAPASLVNLSALYRQVRLARGLGMSVEELVALRRLSGLDPFAAGSEHAVQFVGLADRVRDTGLSIAELDYLLTHRGAQTSPVHPSVQTIAAVLTDLRAGLRAVRDDTAPRPDATGELLAETLAALGWPPELVQTVVTTLATTAATVDRSFVLDTLRTCTWPTFDAELAALPRGLQIPDPLRKRLYYDTAAGRLYFVGVMSRADRAAAEALAPGDPGWLAAVRSLFDAPSGYRPPPEAALYTAADAAELATDTHSPAERFALVLARLLRYLRTVTSARFAAQRLGEAVGLDPSATAELLDALPSITSAGDTALADFLGDALVDSDPAVPITPAAFGPLFRGFVRLVKAVRLATALGFSTAELRWLADVIPTIPARPVTGADPAVPAGWLSPAELPTADGDAAAPFPAWLRLAGLAMVRNSLRGGAETLIAIVDLARSGTATLDDVLDALAARIEADPADLGYLARTVLGLGSGSELADDETLERLVTALRRARRLGAPVQVCHQLARPELDETDARAARSLVKAHYSDATWAQVARPLVDALRIRQRDALVAYLTAPVAGRRRWADANELYGSFLVDVEISPCAMTSRLKQAIGSVQQFVQRCLLHLEPDITADDDHPGWGDWAVMRNYRVWEATRKIFLYPENWLEPELRDDRSPLFQAAEAELTSGEVTADLADDVYGHYLEGLDAVARLEIAGEFLERGDDAHPDVLHVFGRSAGAATPAHFYRQRVDGRWTAWEQLDLDISSRQLIPIVWGGQLYLFWPVFTEGADPPAGDAFDGPQQPNPYVALQLAWSRRRGGAWQPKQVTAERLVSDFPPREDLPDRGRGAYTFRTSLRRSGELWIWYEHDESADPVPRPQWRNRTDFDVRKVGGGFAFTGCDATTLPLWVWETGVDGPGTTTIDGMDFVEGGERALLLPSSTEADAEEVALGDTPGSAPFRLAYAHRDGGVTGTSPFFFADDTRSYFVEPRTVPEWRLADPEAADPGRLDFDPSRYYQFGNDIRQRPPSPVALLPDSPVARYLTNQVAGPAQFSAGGIPDREGGIRLAPRVTPATRMLALRAETWAPPGGTRFLSGRRSGLLTLGEAVDDLRLAGPAPRFPTTTTRKYLFETFFHPYSCRLLQTLRQDGVDALLRRSTQLAGSPLDQGFDARYHPARELVLEHDPDTGLAQPIEDLDFSYGGAYSVYNWELFFHLPLLIATRLSQNQRFEEAQRWFHAIFDPTDTEDSRTPRRFWRTKPFYQHSQGEVIEQRIDRILRALTDGVADEDLTQQVRLWHRFPAQPHVLARLRIAAYQRNVVMRYLDNLIAWADHLFRRDTLETINEATQLYVLAATILGPRPTTMPPRAQPQVQTAGSLRASLDEFSDPMVEIEYLFGGLRADAVTVTAGRPPADIPRMLYFCIPPNDKLLGYWDLVADRLFKIRHCLNIEGVERALPLFEPPIDPALLVRAAAAGVDLAAALTDASAPPPNYRFGQLVSKAGELCTEVKSLGAALLSALEKQDAEALAALRAGHELSLLKAVEQTRIQQHAEATAQIEALRRSRATAGERWLHWQRMLGKTDPKLPAEGTAPPLETPPTLDISDDDGTPLLKKEKTEREQLRAAQDKTQLATHLDNSASVVYSLGDINFATKPFGVGGGYSIGGAHIGRALQAAGGFLRGQGAARSYQAGKSARAAQLALRHADWVLQSNLAAREVAQLDQQIVAATLRQAVTQLELDNHRKQIDNAQQISEFLTGKYTNQQLYHWMIGQLSQVYFPAYRLAYDVAKRAERAWRHELGRPDSQFVQYGYWDSLRKGLLAGEALYEDVKRMELAYLEQNRREFELTKRVSVAALDPLALVGLRETGACTIRLPEALFDLDCPGHYFRRIKSVSLSIPCVVGPYTSVNATLTLLSSSIRTDPEVADGYQRRPDADPRFLDVPGGLQSVVTSGGSDDAGLFEVNLRDERYLPFEGAGAAESLWRIELPSEYRQFDYDTIADVILQLRYTARGGGISLREQALDGLRDAVNGLAGGDGRSGLTRMFSARHEFPDAWRSFVAAGGDGDRVLTIRLGTSRFPYLFHGKQITVDAAQLVLVPADARVGGKRLTEVYADGDPLQVSLAAPGQQAQPAQLVPGPIGGLPATEPVSAGITVEPVEAAWTVTTGQDDIAALAAPFRTADRYLDPDAVDDLLLVLHYHLE